MTTAHRDDWPELASLFEKNSFHNWARRSAAIVLRQK
jgi:hypothetical protein